MALARETKLSEKRPSAVRWARRLTCIFAQSVTVSTLADGRSEGIWIAGYCVGRGRVYRRHVHSSDRLHHGLFNQPRRSRSDPLLGDRCGETRRLGATKRRISSTQIVMQRGVSGYYFGDSFCRTRERFLQHAGDALAQGGTMCIAFCNGVLIVGGRRQAAQRLENLKMVRSAAVNPKSSVSHVAESRGVNSATSCLRHRSVVGASRRSPTGCA